MLYCLKPPKNISIGKYGLIISLPLILSINASPDNLQNSPFWSTYIFSIALFFCLLKISWIDIVKLEIDLLAIRLVLVLGLISNVIENISAGQSHSFSIINYAFSILFPFLLFRILSLISSFILKKNALGSGDAKVAGIAGGWLGIRGSSIAIAIAFVSAGVFSIYGHFSRRIKKSEPFPFAPFLSFGIWSVWILGSDWWVKFWLSLWGL